MVREVLIQTLCLKKVVSYVRIEGDLFHDPGDLFDDLDIASQKITQFIRQFAAANKYIKLKLENNLNADQILTLITKNKDNESTSFIKPICNLLIKKYGGNVDTRNEFNQTLLMTSIINNNLEAVKSLISNNANLYLKDDIYLSPLMFTVENPDISIIKYLLENGYHLKEDIETILLSLSSFIISNESDNICKYISSIMLFFYIRENNIENNLLIKACEASLLLYKLKNKNLYKDLYLIKEKRGLYFAKQSLKKQDHTIAPEYYRKDLIEYYEKRLNKNLTGLQRLCAVTIKKNASVKLIKDKIATLIGFNEDSDFYDFLTSSEIEDELTESEIAYIHKQLEIEKKKSHRMIIYLVE